MKRKFIAFLLALTIVLPLVSVNVNSKTNKFDGGDGTSSDPYRVSTADQLHAVRNDLKACYIQVADIDLSDIEWMPIGYTPLADEGASFEGIYDGNGFKISNLSISTIDESNIYIGLFGNNQGTLKNIVLESLNIDIHIDGTTLKSPNGWYYSPYFGGISGCSVGTIENCTVAGSISVSCEAFKSSESVDAVIPDITIGGIVGSGTCNNCVNYANIKGSGICDFESLEVQCGGIAGFTGSVNGVIQNCINFGDIYSSADGFSNAGGITGEDGSIHYCINVGNITSNSTAFEVITSAKLQSNAGGIVGVTSADLSSNCINLGNVSSTKTCEDSGCTAGGIVGFLGYYSSGKISDCYNLGKRIHSDSTYPEKNSKEDDSATYVGAIYGDFYWWDGVQRATNCYSVDYVNLSDVYVDTVVGYNGEISSVLDMNSDLQKIFSELGLIWEDFEKELTDASSFSGICYFTRWNADTQTAYFGDFDFLGSRVNEKTDTSFIANIDNLIGKYVWVESEPVGGGIVDSDILICIKEVETRTGTVSYADSTITIIDGVSYNTPDNITLPGIFEGEHVRYFLSNGTLLGMELIDGSGDGSDDNQGESGDIIVDNSNDSKKEIIVYALDTSLTFRVGTEFSILCKLKENGVFKDWYKPSVTIGNDKILSLVKCEKIDSDYKLTFRGKAVGTTTVSITDSSDGTFTSVSFTVAKSCAEPLVYTIETVPSFYPDYLGDRKNLTNFYDVNDLYVKNFPENPKLVNGEYHLTFDVYNASYMHGSVDVYNANGEWIRSQCIDKYSDISSITDSVVTAWSMAKNVKRTFSYMSSSYSQHTHIDIYVPEGGYIVISNNMAKSPGTYLYNAVDLMVMWAELTMDITVNSASLKNIRDMTLKEVLKSQAFFDAHMKQFNSFAVKVVGEAAELSIADSMDVITTQTSEMFEDLGLDFWSIVSFASGISESIFISALPPIAKLPLEFLSATTKFFNAASQTLDISYSGDKEYIVLYTTSSDHMIVEGVSASPSQGALPDNAVMKVFRVSNDEAPLIIGTESVVDTYEVYNISFVVNNSEVQPNGYVTVRIPLPDGYSAKGTRVLHEVSDGVWETVDSRVENGFIVFEVNHFSNFAVAHIESNDSNETTENTTSATSETTSSETTASEIITTESTTPESMGTEVTSEVDPDETKLPFEETTKEVTTEITGEHETPDNSVMIWIILAIASFSIVTVVFLVLLKRKKSN